MSEQVTTAPEAPKQNAEEPPPIDPDEDLMADVEGGHLAVKAYKRSARELRKAGACA